MKFICFFPALLLAGSGCAQQTDDLIETKCNSCHSSAVVYEQKRSKQDWDRVVFGMKSRGLEISETEEADLKNFLYRHLTIE